MSMATLAHTLAGATALELKWFFERLSVIENDRPNDDERFHIENRVECSIRELLQNLLDCGSNFTRILFRKVHVNDLRNLGFDEIEERIIGLDAYEFVVDEDGMVSCMEIIDDGCGLGGEHRKASGIGKPSGFQSYARGVGNSSKGHGSSGSKGVGRTAIMASSTVRAVVVLTQPKATIDPVTGEKVQEEPRAFGLIHLDFHPFRGFEYKNAGRLMKLEQEGSDTLAVPYLGQEAIDLAGKVGIVRVPGAQGTTQLFPSIRPEFTAEAVISDIVKNHFVAILTGRITIEVEDYDGETVTINANTIIDLAAQARFGGNASLSNQVKLVKQLLDMRGSALDVGVAKGRLSEDQFEAPVLEKLKEDFAEGLPVAIQITHEIRQRRGRKGELPCSGTLFHACVESPDAKGCEISIREGIVRISNRGGDFVSVTVAEGDDVANMLRDGEDNSHTKWTPRKMKDAGWPQIAAETVSHDFQKGGRVLHDILVGAEDKIEDTGLSRVFGMPDNDATRGKKNRVKGTGEDQAPVPEVQPHVDDVVEPEVHPDAIFASESYRLANGRWGARVFFNEKGRERFEPDHSFYLGFVYDQVDGKPRWDHHSPADFDLRVSQPETEGCTAEAVTSNVVKIVVEDVDFEIRVSGFHADRRVKGAEVALEDGEGDETDADQGE